MIFTNLVWEVGANNINVTLEWKKSYHVSCDETPNSS